MVALETRVMVKVPSYGEVLEEVKVEVLRLVGEKVVEFQEEQFRTWLGIPWHREKDASGIILCPRCVESSGFERRERRGRCFHTRYGKMESALLQVTCKRCGCTFSPFVGFFSEKGKRYSRDLVENLVLSALTASYHETSRRAERETGIKAAAITVWRQLKEAYQKYRRRQKSFLKPWWGAVGRLHRGEDGEDQERFVPEPGYQGNRQGSQRQTRHAQKGTGHLKCG